MYMFHFEHVHIPRRPPSSVVGVDRGLMLAVRGERVGATPQGRVGATLHKLKVLGMESVRLKPYGMLWWF
jgi:hypothetical protein